MKQLALIILFAARVQAAELQALILTGAGSEAAATPLLEAAKKRAAAATDVLVLADGFPRLVQSDTVTGLKPGFWIVLAGFCAEASTLDALKALDAGAYAKPVQLDAAPSCPRLVEGWSVTTVEAKDATKRTLRGVLFSPGSSSDEWKLYVSLREKTGTLVAERVLEQAKDTRCVSGGGNELRVKAGTLVMKSTDCQMPRGCPNPGDGTTSVTVSALGQELAVESKVLKDPGYGGCRGE